MKKDFIVDQISLFDDEEKVQETSELREKIYTSKIQIPQYIPSAICPSLTECYDLSKYMDLMREIDQSHVSEEEKSFLKIAATRHIKFTYSKAADYYSHASKEMQKLMENSALVLIDFNDAIANGYVQLSSRMDEIIGDALDD